MWTSTSPAVECVFHMEGGLISISSAWGTDGGGQGRMSALPKIIFLTWPGWVVWPDEFIWAESVKGASQPIPGNSEQRGLDKRLTSSLQRLQHLGPHASKVRSTEYGMVA